MLKTIVILFLFVASLYNGNVQSQKVKKAEFKYISPVPGSKYIMPQNNIAFRHGDPIKPESLQNFKMVVSGSKSGMIAGRIELSGDGRTIIFKPDEPFKLGEEVQVIVYEGLKTKTGIKFEQKEFSFFITSSIPDLPENYFLGKEFGNAITQKKAVTGNKLNNNSLGKNNILPEDYPLITINSSEDLSPDGYYFVAPFSTWGWYPNATPYMIIMDEYGTPVFYRRESGPVYDFKKLYNGNLVYYANFDGLYKWIIEDNSYNYVDDYAINNGYWTDWHEFLLLSENGHEGHAIVMAYDPQFVDMSVVIPGGNPNAIVSGWVIQELDINKNVVFKWRSWDHYLITDANEYVDLTDSIIDPFHGNAIAVYSDSALLLSPRNLDEITKIDWNTGNIIWRLGGKNNMYEFENDTLGFSMQHDCRRLENGNVSLFDNGTYHPENFSSVVEYALDEINFTATLMNRYRNDPDAFGTIMGNGQETETGNIIAGWGSSGEPAITEFDPQGNILAEISIESINYRAYRYPWKTSYFLLETDTLQFGSVWHEYTSMIELYVYNNSNHDISISSYYSMNEAFTVENEFPITISQDDSTTLKVKFNPGEVGLFEGMLTINSDINSDTLVQRIAQQVYLVGNATEGQGYNELTDDLKVIVYPNPVIKNLVIKFPQKNFNGTIQLYDIFGRDVFSQVFDEINILELNIEEFSAGVYFVYLKERHNTGSHFYKIIKN